MKNLIKAAHLFTLTLLIVLSPSIARAQVQFVGGANYKIENGLVTISFDQLNHVLTRETGTIYVTLAAMTNNSPTGTGYELASMDMVTLQKYITRGSINYGHYYHDITFITDYSAPPPGSYYIYLLAFEAPHLDTVIASVPISTTPVFLSNVSSGPGSSSLRENYFIESTGSLTATLGESQTHIVHLSTLASGHLQLASSGGTDTVARLFLKQGSSLLLLAEDDDSGDWLNFSISATVPPGEFELHITTYNGNVGQYTLLSSFTPSEDVQSITVSGRSTERAGGTFVSGLTLASSATFSIGMTKDNQNYVSSTLAWEPVKIVGSIRPEPQHIGRFANIYVVARVNDRFMMLTSSGNYISWDTRIPNLVPYKQSTVLKADTLVEIHNGVLREIGAHAYFIGYMVNGDFLRYTPTPVIFDVKRF